MTLDLLWYIPNGETGAAGSNAQPDLDDLVETALSSERGGWDGALIGTGWTRPDTFTIGASVLARSTKFEALIAARPGYWQPAHFAAASATLDCLSKGRVRINIVSGLDGIAAYGDAASDSAERYERTKEFIRIVRRLWTEERVSYEGKHFRVSGSTLATRPAERPGRRHPKLYFGGASAAAERVAATEADVQLFWGEPLSAVEERILRLQALSRELDREHPPLEFGLRVVTLVRDTEQEAWAEAERRVAALAAAEAPGKSLHLRAGSVGQQRLTAFGAAGDVLDDNLYTAPARYGAGGATSTWLVGTPAQVASSLEKYRNLGVTHFVLSGTPNREEGERQAATLLPLLRG